MLLFLRQLLETGLASHGYIISRAYGGERARPECQGRGRVHEYRIQLKSSGGSRYLSSFSSHFAFVFILHSPRCTILSTPRARASHFRILYRTPGVNIAPLVLEAIEIAPLSPTPAPLLGSGEILELGLF